MIDIYTNVEPKFIDCKCNKLRMKTVTLDIAFFNND